MSVRAAIERANREKADFDDIYDAPDPRAYFATLCDLDYQIPQNARPWLQRIIAALQVARAETSVTLLDIGCSYGINAALLKFGVDLDDLQHRYRMTAAAGLDADELIDRDRAYFASRGAEAGVDIVGLDIAENATAYGVRAGLLDAAVTADLEREAPTPEDADLLGAVDAIISTGCIGYVTERSFDRILRARLDTPPPWVASFVLRMFPYDVIAATLARYGLRTVKLANRTFVQRRFENDDERDGVMEALRSRGVPIDNVEAQGYLHAELFLSYPPAEMPEPPLDDRWVTVAEP